jgi:hypothetical protein
LNYGLLVKISEFQVDVLRRRKFEHAFKGGWHECVVAGSAAIEMEVVKVVD